MVSVRLFCSSAMFSTVTATGVPPWRLLRHPRSRGYGEGRQTRFWNMRSRQARNYWDVLGIPRGAVRRIEEGYKQALASGAFDPDLVEEAYRTLSDPMKRSLYEISASAAPASGADILTFEPVRVAGVSPLQGVKTQWKVFWRTFSTQLEHVLVVVGLSVCVVASVPAGVWLNDTYGDPAAGVVAAGLIVLLGLVNGLRQARIYVPGSQRTSKTVLAMTANGVLVAAASVVAAGLWALLFAAFLIYLALRGIFAMIGGGK